MKSQKNKIIHSIIGIAIMILFQFLPLSIPHVTTTGMQVLGIFLGTLYLWTTVDPLWSSLISIMMLAFSSYADMNTILTSYLGNSLLMLMLFIMLLSGALVSNKITVYIARFFMTLKFTNGKPWLFAFAVCVGCFLMSAFVNPFAPIFLFWPILYAVFDEIGYDKNDKFPKIMIVLVVASSLIGFPVPPYMGNGLVLIGNYKSITTKMSTGVVAINDAAYLFTGLILGLIVIAILVLLSKYILKPDTSKFNSFDNEILNKNPLPPMSLQQKIVSYGFIVLIILMLLPAIIPKSVPGISYLSEISYGLPLLVAAILAAIPLAGKPVLDIQKVISEQFNWGTYFLCATAIMLGNALVNESTGISKFISSTLGPVFSGMNVLTFTIVSIVICVILTNFCNSLVIAMIFEPVVATYCMASGVDARPIVTLVILSSLGAALLTPAASPFAAVLHGNRERLPAKDAYKYTLFYVIVELILFIIIGIPVSNVLSGL